MSAPVHATCLRCGRVVAPTGGRAWCPDCGGVPVTRSDRVARVDARVAGVRVCGFLFWLWVVGLVLVLMTGAVLDVGSREPTFVAMAMGSIVFWGLVRLYMIARRDHAMSVLLRESPVPPPSPEDGS